MMKTLNKMKDKLQREGVELRSAREQVLDLSSRINDISVSTFFFFLCWRNFLNWNKNLVAVVLCS